MIIFCHDLKLVTEIIYSGDHGINLFSPILPAIIEFSQKNPNETIIWCHEKFITKINFQYLESLHFSHSFIISFNPCKNNYLSNDLGLVDQALFLNVNKGVVYPTWLMSSVVGAISASTLAGLDSLKFRDFEFDYFLNSFAKQNMHKGLFCYSVPDLMKSNQNLELDLFKSSDAVLYKFVRDNYRFRWIVILFVQQIIYFGRIEILPFINAVLSKPKIELPEFKTRKLRNDVGINVAHETIDVIIPTLKRKNYLKIFLNDLSLQTLKPKNVIVVEQLKDGDQSELDYLKTEKWPFNIIHICTHQFGACNARNIALKHIKSSWLFFADDDIKIDIDFLERGLIKIKNLSIKAGQFFTYMEGEVSPFHSDYFQWNAFGTCSSIISSQLIKMGCKFDLSFEHGYGEDSDFGMQIRAKGVDVIHFNDPKIFHFKAANGGFRYVVKKPWDEGKLKPIPSPTVMLFNKKYLTPEQRLSYKTIFIVKSILSNSLVENIRLVFFFSRRWKLSKKWANNLDSEN